MQTFQDLNQAEREWVAACIAGAESLVAEYCPTQTGQPLTAKLLDETFAGWLTTNDSDTERVNNVINSIGMAFGQLLVDQVGFKWVVVTDEFGCDMGVLALPGSGDVLVCPTHVVAKRWESRETSFLEPMLSAVQTQIEKTYASRLETGAKKSWWKPW